MGGWVGRGGGVPALCTRPPEPSGLFPQNPIFPVHDKSPTGVFGAEMRHVATSPPLYQSSEGERCSVATESGLVAETRTTLHLGTPWALEISNGVEKTPTIGCTAQTPETTDGLWSAVLSFPHRASSVPSLATASPAWPCPGWGSLGPDRSVAGHKWRWDETARGAAYLSRLAALIPGTLDFADAPSLVFELCLAVFFLAWMRLGATKHSSSRWLSSFSSGWPSEPIWEPGPCSSRGGCVIHCTDCCKGLPRRHSVHPVPLFVSCLCPCVFCAPLPPMRAWGPKPEEDKDKDKDKKGKGRGKKKGDAVNGVAADEDTPTTDAP